MRVKSILVLVAVIGWSSAVNAQVNCGTQPVDVPPDIQQSFKGDVEGKAELFTRLLGDANLKGKVETSRSEIHQKYKNIDQSVIDRYMVWVSCQGIMQDQQLSPAEKTKLWLEIYRELSRTTKTQSRIPSTLFNDIEIGRVGQTSIEYVASILGTPKTRDDRSASFVVDGYEVTANYLDRDSVNGQKGTLIRLSALVRSPSEAQSSPIVLDGYWNPEGCNDVEKGECRKDILPLKLADQHRLAEYIENTGNGGCSTEGGPMTNTDYSFNFVRPAYGSTNFIETQFDVEVVDEKAYSAASLLNHYTEAGSLDADIVNNFRQELDIKSHDNIQAILEIREKFDKICFESTVIGFAISVEGIEDYYENP